MEIRKCNKCQENKPLVEFDKDKSRKDGYGYKCKKCQSEYRRQKYINNPELKEKILAKQREQYHLNPTSQNQRSKNWREANPEKFKKGVKDWSIKNPYKAKEYGKKWYKLNTDEFVSVYLLPAHNYVGITNSMYRRMEIHRNRFKRNTEGVRVLYQTKSRDEALELEELLHDLGYEGRDKRL
jgi:methionyl-tRNA synthetase